MLDTKNTPICEVVRCSCSDTRQSASNCKADDHNCICYCGEVEECRAYICAWH